MIYAKYITKKRFKGLALSGAVNLPYGTVCDFLNSAICLDGNPICYLGSQNAKDYFWGYDENNPEGEIERQKAADELSKLAPEGDADELMDRGNPWSQYGYIDGYGFGMYQWIWKDETLDLPIGKLQRLIDCVRKGENPHV
jgi:hypothetical protein